MDEGAVQERRSERIKRDREREIEELLVENKI